MARCPTSLPPVSQVLLNTVTSQIRISTQAFVESSGARRVLGATLPISRLTGTLLVLRATNTSRMQPVCMTVESHVTMKYFLSRFMAFIQLLLFAPTLHPQQSSPPLFVVHEANRCGFVDSAGRVVVPLSFTGCEDFSEEYGPVQVGSEWGFIDRDGNTQIAPQFDEARWSFSEGLAAVRSGKKWGYIDKTGKFVIAPRFDYAQGFTDGRAIVLVGEKHGVIDRTGTLLGRLYDFSAWEFSEGLLAVQLGDLWGFIDASGKYVIPLQFHNALSFSEGLAAVEASAEKNRWGFVDHQGKFVIEPRFGDAGFFGEGLAPVEVDFRYGYIDKEGKTAIKPQFDHAYQFTEGLACVKNVEQKYGFIDKSGKTVIEPKYDLSFPFHAGLAAVGTGNWHWDDPHAEGPHGNGLPVFNGNWGYIDREGREVWQSSN